MTEETCRWCDQQARTDDEHARLGLCPAHTVNLLHERKRTLEEQNQALELLWAICDEINAAPRHGNVFERSAEALAKLRDGHIASKLGVADKALVHCLREHGNGSVAEDALEIIRTK